MMKKIYGFLFVATLLFVSGCKQDEVLLPFTLQDVNLFGTWYLKELVITPEDPTLEPDTLTSFTKNDYFEFKTGSAATFSSSTLYGKIYEGYYSINAAANPQMLSFKSGTLLLRYSVESIDQTTFTVFEDKTDVENGLPVDKRYYYTYSRLP